MNPIKQRLRSALAALLMLGSTQAGAAGYVAMGHVDLSFYEVTASLVQQVLERMGCNVSVKKGSHAQIYPLLGNGEVDLFVAAWLPNAHARYWEEYKDSTVKVVALYEDARLFWAVPDYIPAADVGSVADLRKPEVAAKMQKEVRGPGADSGLMLGSKKIFTEYGLEESGYNLLPGKPADWIANFNDNVAAGRWFVMPLWQPQYLNKSNKLRVLDEPKKLLGGSDTAWLVAHKDLRSKVDAKTWKALQRMSLSVRAVTEMDYLVNVQKMSPRDAARHWMGSHPDTVSYWIYPDAED
ncbi:MAG TPA: glycine betaine ABC transporter substrate-binding protein [Burkholderiales bacterium]